MGGGAGGGGGDVYGHANEGECWICLELFFPFHSSVSLLYILNIKCSKEREVLLAILVRRAHALTETHHPYL